MIQWSLVGVALSLSLVVPCWAQAHPDFTGRYWTNPGYGTPGKEGDASPNRGPSDARNSLDKLTLKGQFKTTFDGWMESMRAGRPVGDISAQCRPAFLLGPMVNNVYPTEVLQTRDQLIMLFEGTDRVRHIYLSPKDQPPASITQAAFGVSIGHWEGDELIIKTDRFSASTTIAGAPHSLKVRTTERLKRVQGTRNIQNDVTVEDPDALAEPYHLRFVFRSEPKIHMMEYSCEENNRNTIYQADGDKKIGKGQ